MMRFFLGVTSPTTNALQPVYLQTHQARLAGGWSK
ncbi:MAG: hypothetical protein BMS9Abin37_0627 [Acidobacteriota bacterium]|nr:MAG: hypothetical protein BMS9Abin37_0627 [Acidobacteriota bacterium]